MKEFAKNAKLQIALYALATIQDAISAKKASHMILTKESAQDAKKTAFLATLAQYATNAPTVMVL